jgi:two-component system, OmpR family, response regulator
LGGRFSGRGSVVVADPDEGFRREIGRALTAAGFEVVEAASGDEALAAALDGVVLAVLDVRLPGISGYEVCRRLREELGDRVAIVFVSADRVESSDRVAGLIVGADDYLVKPVARDEIVARVRRLLARSPGGGPRPRLTEREGEVLRLLAAGLGPAQIGKELSISPKTVATHVEHIYAKLGVHTRAQAVAQAFRLALVE